MKIALAALGWLLSALIGYVVIRAAGRKYGWQVGDRNLWLSICLLMGPIALVASGIIRLSESHNAEKESKW